MSELDASRYFHDGGVFCPLPRPVAQMRGPKHCTFHLHFSGSEGSPQTHCEAGPALHRAHAQSHLRRDPGWLFLASGGRGASVTHP